MSADCRCRIQVVTESVELVTRKTRKNEDTYLDPNLPEPGVRVCGLSL